MQRRNAHPRLEIPEPRLRCQSYRSVARPIAVVPMTLHDLEEEAFCECARIEVVVRAAVIFVVEDVELRHARKRFMLEAEACAEVVVVILRDGQELLSERTHPGGGG